MKKLILVVLALLICASAHSAGKFVLQGSVLLSTGAPAAGLRVQVLQRLGKKTFLQGSARTAGDGTYRVIYAPRTGRKGPTVIVRVLDTRGRKIYQSPWIKHAKPLERLNVTLP